MNLDYVVASLWFWQTLSDETKKGDEKEAWKRQLRAELDVIDDEPLASLTEISRRRYEEQEAARGSVSSRGTSLLLFVGVVTTGATLVGGSLESVRRSSSARRSSTGRFCCMRAWRSRSSRSEPKK